MMRSCFRSLFVVLAVGFALVPSMVRAAEVKPFLEVREEPVLRGLIHLPGLLVTEADTVVVIAQSRVSKGDFDPSDVVVTRSVDAGKNWSAPVKLFASDGVGTIGYSCVLVEDRKSDPNVLLAYYTTGPVPWKAEQLVWLGRRSTDEGTTWSEPFAVKHDGDAESKPSNGGHGFQLASGRLVIPGRKSFLTSDDGGTTWVTHKAIDSVETKVAPLAMGGAKGWDAVYTMGRKTLEYQVFDKFGDGPILKGEHGNAFTMKGRNPGLATMPLVTTDGGEELPPLLLTSGMIEKEGKVLSVNYSKDQGKTWSARKRVADEKAWYSDLGVMKDGTVIVAYTVGFSADLKVARFNEAWLMME